MKLSQRSRSTLTTRPSPRPSLTTTLNQWWVSNYTRLVVVGLALVSVAAYVHYYSNGLGLAYNDARSHLNIGRRVVEGLQPGLAQIGSVWLPLPHLLMVLTVWNDFMWHSGLAGAIQSMVSFVIIAVLVMKFLQRLNVGIVGQLLAAAVFAFNLNVLYLQSTAMTELLLMAMMTAAAYELLRWSQTESIVYLIRTALWVMLSTLIRYDGWFLCAYIFVVVVLYTWKKRGWRTSEGMVFFYCTLAGFGIALWIAWNWIIFGDPLYFIFGPYSAHTQQQQIEAAGQLLTKHNLWLSSQVYFLATVFNIGVLPLALGGLGLVILMLDRRHPLITRVATTALLVPFMFNVLSLYLGHSVVFLEGFFGGSWFNVRYGVLSLPAVAVGVGYLADRWRQARWLAAPLVIAAVAFTFVTNPPVTIADATKGSSQKNVTEVSTALRNAASQDEGFILIAAASHDAIIFSTGLPMSRFIHEGTGEYWHSATTSPDRWARWIVMRTHDMNDQTYALVSQSGALDKYQLIDSYPFADIYELKREHLATLQTEPVLPRQ